MARLRRTRLRVAADQTIAALDRPEQNEALFVRRSESYSYPATGSRAIAQEGEPPVSEEETRNKTSGRRFFEEIWSKGNFAVLNDLVAANYIDHDSNTPSAGPDGVRQEVSLYRNAFPDLLFTIEDIIAEGDKVVTRLTASGTHERDLPGIAATGKRVTIAGMYMTRFENGKAAEAWVKFDFLGLYRQLGVIPARGAAPAGTTR